MGWSCSSKASAVLQAWIRACLAQTDFQNTYKVGDRTFLFDVSNKEHDDGAITGNILEAFNIHPEGFSSQCRKVGSFRINGDGSVARAPKFLKDAAKSARPVVGGIGSGGPIDLSE